MAIFPLKRLAKKHPGIWRVDGIGPIKPSAKLGTRVTVHFSGIAPGRVNDPYKRGAVLPGVQLPFPIHVALLRAFKVGTVWHEGRCIYRPQSKSPEVFHIDVSKAQYVALDEAVTLNGVSIPSVLPDDYFYLANNREILAASRYAIVPVIGNPMVQWLVVPAIELLRFYVGVSSRFLTGALSGRLDKYVDWNRVRMEETWPVLQVKTRLSRTESFVLGRAVASSSAREALFGTHQHLATVNANNQLSPLELQKPLAVHARFPFRDETTLMVEGKRMCLYKRGGQQEWTMFAMEIVQCKHPLEFSNVVLESDEPWAVEAMAGGAPTGVRPPHFNPLLQDDEEDLLVDDVPADGRLPRLAVLQHGSPFAGFKQLTFHHRRPKAPLRANEPGGNIDVPVSTLTMNEGQQTEEAKGNLGVSDFLNHTEDVGRNLEQFLDVLDYLQRRTRARGWVIETRRGDEGIRAGQHWITFFPDPIGSRTRWHWIDEANAGRRRRQLICAEIKLGQDGPFFYLMEMELGPTEPKGQCTLLVHTPEFQWMDDEVLDELLQLTVLRRRWPDIENKWKKDQEYRRAQALFSKIKADRVQHPNSKSKRPRKPDSVDGAASPSEVILTASHPNVWSASLLSRIDDLLPGFSDGPGRLMSEVVA
ncbi:hypothetical protein LQD23_06855 [Chromobacterium violaceum]|uniref:hypothetical protein n=1 Tax=Chromobacterium violaceum TaxID=536 RepID=UPI001E2F2F7C|nr:hypothetical protein [Chromobacterium violaceum]MCD0492013.1 hypothetical protein [Chromobacterium violaceum]